MNLEYWEGFQFFTRAAVIAMHPHYLIGSLFQFVVFYLWWSGGRDYPIPFTVDEWMRWHITTSLLIGRLVLFFPQFIQ